MAEVKETNSTNGEPPKTDHWYRASKGDDTFIFSIERGTAFSNDQNNQDYYLHIHRGPSRFKDEPSSRTSNFGDALSFERNYKISLIEQGYKVDRIDLPGKRETLSQTPTTRTQKEKPEHTHDKQKHDKPKPHEKEQKQTERPDNIAPEQEGKKVEDPKPNPEKQPDTRVEAQQPQTEGEKGIDWGTVAESAGSSILKGAGIAAAGAGLVAVGAVSAPFLAGAGLAFSIGMGVNTFFSRANEAMDSGVDDYFGSAASAGVSDMVPFIDVVGIGEAATGFNYMTGEEMTQQERSEKVGGLIGSAAMDFAPIAGLITPKTKKALQKDFVNDVAKEFKKSFKEAPGKDKMTKSNIAHKVTQGKILKKYGKDQVVNEPQLGITHFGLNPDSKPKFNHGARGDIANFKLDIIVELKSYVKLNDKGQIEVNKKIGKEWVTTYTNQIKSLELNAKVNRDQLTVVITSNGDKIKFNPNTNKWSKMN